MIKQMIATMFAIMFFCLFSWAAVPAKQKFDLSNSNLKLTQELVVKYGDGAKERVSRGLKQVSDFWRSEDGTAEEYESFVRENFAGDQKTLDQIFEIFETSLEQLDGHMLEIGREFRRRSDLDVGPLLPLDQVMAGYDPAAHVDDDFFQNKFAFVALLNFPLTTLQEKLNQGDHWTRRQWAEARLADRFSKRVPASVNQQITEATSQAETYISQYNIWMHHLLDEKGNRLFPAKLRLITHWNLRDELKADYSEPDGLPKQRMIQQVMERIVNQTIPAAVIDNPMVDWNLFTNEVKASTEKDWEDQRETKSEVHNSAEPDTRYRMLLNIYRAERKEDPYSPNDPTQIDRSFNEQREIPETRVKEMLDRVLSSPLVARVGRVIQKRLGRNLEPFDIWYNGFRPRGKYTEEQLDEIVSKKYPTPAAYAADIPNILQKLGFTKEKATWLATNIIVDPSRGAGHALQSARREDKVHLRTRVEKGGMNYKGYNIAVHEMGHNVEQTFSLNAVDHTLLSGVPNNAFTEALAFVFQGHDLELLGLAKPDAANQAMKTLNDFWATYEIGGVAMVDMGVWHWMYDHPNATTAQLKLATIQISKDVWNRYYASLFGKRDVVLLGIYSHMINYPLYLPDYPIGHLIAFQIEEQMEKAGNIGSEFERMAKMGHVTPDLWMQNATGAPVGPDALLRATESALQQVQ